MTTKSRKPPRKPGRYAKLREAARRYLANPPLQAGQAVYAVRLEASQVKALKQLARAHGTTLNQELDYAIDAYCLGVSRRGIRLLDALVDRMNESTARANRALDAALRETGKTRAHCARKNKAQTNRNRK